MIWRRFNFAVRPSEARAKVSRWVGWFAVGLCLSGFSAQMVILPAIYFVDLNNFRYYRESTQVSV